ncbi:MAG: DnaA/Hda family protein [Hyphomicrobiales bacterium]|nr:DnaA/Hda family protein [Hyphomicrobiales bacterium]
MVEQLLLPLAARSDFSAEDFIVSACNEAAAGLVAAWPRWPGRVCVIVGAEGAGKTHLGHIWRARAGARLAAPGDAEAMIGEPAPLLIDDADASAFDETAFFHLLNLSKERGFDMLLTARIPPGEWTAALPDLRSRFRSLPFVAIAAPDDELLRLLLIKHFADRQVTVAPDVIAFLIPRIERTAAAARDIARDLDAAALRHGRPVTRALARDVLQARRASGLEE